MGDLVSRGVPITQSLSWEDVTCHLMFLGSDLLALRTALEVGRGYEVKALQEPVTCFTRGFCKREVNFSLPLLDWWRSNQHDEKPMHNILDYLIWNAHAYMEHPHLRGELLQV